MEIIDLIKGTCSIFTLKMALMPSYFDNKDDIGGQLLRTVNTLNKGMYEAIHNRLNVVFTILMDFKSDTVELSEIKMLIVNYKLKAEAPNRHEVLLESFRKNHMN